jgi:MoaA/NifB/PqqE/SkfB family radical SAM enzyme
MYSEKPLLHQRQNAYQPGQLRTVAVDVTPVCNMTCAHCYAETFRKSTPLDLDLMVRALHEFHDIGVFHWVFQGGEAILAVDRLETMLRECHPDESYITLVSNGWAMTPDRIRWLKDRKVDKIAFSMDSGVEAEHDAQRLPGSFQRVCQAVDAVLDEGLFTSISITVTRDSLYEDGFKHALEFAQSKGIRMDVQIAEPVGKWDGQKDLLIRPEDAAYLKKLQQELPRLANGQTAIHRDIFIRDRDHCPAATEFMALSSDGHVLTCNFLQFSLGKVGEMSISAMREAIMSSPWFDGSKPNCICGEDDTFIDTFIVPHTGRPKPLDAYDVFSIPRPPRSPRP